MFACLILFLHQTYTPSRTIDTGSSLHQTSEPGKWNSLSFTLSLKAIQLYADSDSPLLYRINTGTVCAFEVANTFISSLASTVRRSCRVMPSSKWWMNAGGGQQTWWWCLSLYLLLNWFLNNYQKRQKRSFSTFTPPHVSCYLGQYNIFYQILNAQTMPLTTHKSVLAPVSGLNLHSFDVSFSSSFNYIIITEIQCNINWCTHLLL